MLEKGVICWRYWNTCDAAVYIVAVRVAWSHNSAWCAYIGSSAAGKQREENGVMQVREHGEYLLERQARPFFEAEAAKNLATHQPKDVYGLQPVEIFPQAVDGKARDRAAQVTNVNPHYVQDAKAIADKAPELAEEPYSQE